MQKLRISGSAKGVCSASASPSVSSVLGVASTSRIIRRPERKWPDLEPSGSILITGGLGDAIAVESYFTDEHRRALKRIYYATGQHRAIRQLFESIPRYHHVEHIPVWTDFTDFFAFHWKKDLTQTLRGTGKKIPEKWDDVADCSILEIFTAAFDGNLPYNGSSLLDQPLANLQKFGLPERYVVCCPYTVNDTPICRRNFDDADWRTLIEHLQGKGLKAVVLNVGSDSIPTHPTIVDLSNRTTVAEAAEITKQAEGYFGIDSAFSVIAAKLFDPPNLAIKTQNRHLLICKDVYYAPKRKFDFIQKELKIDG